jgi:hypothetical protein
LATEKDWIMRFEKLLIMSITATGLAVSSAAYAFVSDGNGNIRCSDGSPAKAVQRDDGTWTVVQAGAKGKTGGSFAIEGQAALFACGE